MPSDGIRRSFVVVAGGALLTVAALGATGCSGGSATTAPTTAAAPSSPATTGTTGTGPATVASSPPSPSPTTTTSAPPATTTTVAAETQPRYTTGDAEYLFDQDRFHTFAIDLAADALAELDADPAAEEYVEGSLTFEGETVEPLGVRYKGSIGAFVGCTNSPNPMVPSGPKTCRKLSIQLKINWDDPDALFYGVRKVQLHSQNFDPSMMHERLGYWLFREMGVPAPRSTHARVILNGEFVGVFALTEEVDGRFARANFDDGTGNLYKEVWPFDVNGAPRPEADFIAALETNEDEDPTAEIVTGFAADLAAAGADGALAVIDEWADVDLLLRTFVVDRAIRHDDGPLHWYCFGECAPHNFYWYEDPSERELVLIPWDLDNAFDSLTGGSFVSVVIEIGDPWGGTSNGCEPFPYGAMGLQQRSAACDPLVGPLASLDAEYDRLRAELVDGPLSEERIAAQLAQWSAQIEGAVAEAASLHTDAPPVERWRASVEQLRVALRDSLTGTGR